MPDPGPSEVSETTTAPPPALPEFVEPPFGQAPIPVTEASGQHFQDLAPAEPPKLYPPLQVSTDMKGRETLELSRDCALPEPEGTKENRQETYSASCCSEKVYLGPSGKPHLPQGQDSPSTCPKGGPGPGPLQPNRCARCQAFGHWKNECPKARKEEEAPAVVGLADLNIN